MSQITHFYLNAWQPMSLENVLAWLAKELGGKLDRHGVENWRHAENGSIVPQKGRYLVELPTGAPIEMELEGDADVADGKPGEVYRLILHHGERPTAEIHALVEKLNLGFRKVPPPRFLSVPHFRWFLKDAFTSVLATLRGDRFLAAASGALVRLFEGHRSLGVLEDEKEPARRLRIETRPGVFQWVDTYRYTVYAGEHFLGAVGIVKADKFLSDTEEHYQVVCIAREDHIQALTERFGKDFEKLLYSAEEVKGGKFTGSGDFLRLKEKVLPEDLVLEPKIQADVESEIYGFFKLRELYKRAGLPFKRGVVVYGPPGSGKTMLAKVIAGHFAETVFWVKAGDVSEAADFSRLFRLARLGAPSVLIFEDVDMYLRDREDGRDNSTVATLMAEMDGLEENEGLLVMLTTNRLEAVEKAIVDRPGRIDYKIFFGDLGREQVIKLFRRRLAKITLDGDVEKMFPAFTTLTGNKVVELATMSIRLALKDGLAGPLVVKEAHVKKAFQNITRAENAAKVGFRKDE